MNFEFDFLALFLVLGLAWLVPMLISQVKFIRIPVVIVEIIAGFIIGKNILNLLPDESYMDFLGLTGFVFLMFLSGLEIDVNHIIASFPRRKLTFARFLSNPLLVGIFIFTGSVLLSFGATIILANTIVITNIWFFALIMSTSSIGIILPVLKARGEVVERFGQMIVIAAIIADILSILFFTFTASIIKHGYNFEVVAILSLFVVFIIAYYVGRQLMKINLFQRILHQLAHAASQIKVRGTMALILLFLFLSQLIDAEVILGAFLAGLLLSIFLPKERSILMVKLDGMAYGFFIPIFFIMVGANLDLSALRDFDSSFAFVGLLIVTLYVVKVLPALIWSRLFGLKKALAGGFLISSRLSLIIAASQIGLQLNVITPATNAAFILMAVITCILSPILYELLNPLPKFRKDKTIILGGSEIAEQLAKRLVLHNKSVVIVESRKSRMDKLKSAGIEVFLGNAADKEMYEELKLEPKNYVIVLTGSDIRNVKISEMLRNELLHERVLTMAEHSSNIKKMAQLDIKQIDISQTITTAIENLIFRPDTYHAVFESFENFQVEDIKVTNRKIDGTLVKDIPFHQDGSLMLIRRDNEMHIPHGNSFIRIGDVITVFGNETALQDFRTKFV